MRLLMKLLTRLIPHQKDTTDLPLRGGVRRPLSISSRLQSLTAVCRISPQQLQLVFSNLRDVINVVDVFLLLFFSVCAVPIGKVFYKLCERELRKKTSEILLKEDETPREEHESRQTYETSLTHSIADLIQQITRLAAVVYVMDCVVVVMNTLGFEFRGDVSGELCHVLYLTWLAFKVVHWKRYILAMAVSRAPNHLGKAFMRDKILDVVIYGSLLLGIMHIVKFEVGKSLESLYAFGGLGTFVIGLASKDIVAQIVSGITLTTMEKFHIGEYVRLGDGSSGIVENIGWLYTDLRKFDNINIKIPNTQLTDQRVSNYSRIPICRVQARLRVSFTDYKKLPKFYSAVLEELRNVCPHLITEGRPFRANWRACESDHLLLVIDTHHNLKPYGTLFFENQELVFSTIFRVAEECGIRFVVPSINVHSVIDAAPDMSQQNLPAGFVDNVT